MRILITGAAGFIGSHLSAWFRQHGHEVTGTSRQPRADQIQFVLGEPFDASIASGFDVVIHAAHDFESGEATIHGTRSLFEAARQSPRPPRQLLVSSYSARSDAASEYGRVKYRLEQLFLGMGDTVIRPGLVIGSGGMFGQYLQKIVTTPVIPLLDAGRDRVPIISIADTALAIGRIVEHELSGAWNLFHPELPTMRQIVETAARQAGRHPILLPIPTGIALTALGCFRRIGIALPVREDNIRSLKANRIRIHESDLERIEVTPQSLNEAVRAAIQGIRV